MFMNIFPYTNYSPPPPPAVHFLFSITSWVIPNSQAKQPTATASGPLLNQAFLSSHYSDMHSDDERDSNTPRPNNNDGHQSHLVSSTAKTIFINIGPKAVYRNLKQGSHPHVPLKATTLTYPTTVLSLHPTPLPQHCSSGGSSLN